MRRFLCTSVFAAFAAVPFLILGPTTALAVSPSQEQCDAQGGTFTKDQRQIMCVTTTLETVGNAPETSNAQRVETEEIKTGQGNIGNKQQTNSECSGPGNSTAQCP